MTWVKSKVNGNVIEVADPDLVKKLKSEGHEVSESDPRAVKPKGTRK